MTRMCNRRHFLSTVGAGIAGTGLGYGFKGWFRQGLAPARPSSPSPMKRASAETQQVCWAVSLRILQRSLRSAADRQRGSLGGLAQIYGFVEDSNDDVILYGSSSSGHSVGTDCFVVALRNAYKVSAQYQGAPGCTIDPIPGNDPWTIQEVKVLGMPADCPMAARHVALDYELKKVGASVVKVPGIRSTFELLQSAAVCDSAREQTQSIAHRYWFYPLLPASPRYERSEGVVRILAPTGVQLLTERQFLDSRGQRTGATQARPEAEGFASGFTAMLASGTVPRYAALVEDFRVIELAKLMRYAEVPEHRLDFFLWDYTLATVKTPRYVGGVIREEGGMAVCNAAISEQRGAVECRQERRSYRYEYRGGVEARIEMHAANFSMDKPDVLRALRAAVLSSRPSRDSLSWPVIGAEETHSIPA